MQAFFGIQTIHQLLYLKHLLTEKQERGSSKWLLLEWTFRHLYQNPLFRARIECLQQTVEHGEEDGRAREMRLMCTYCSCTHMCAVS